MTLDTLPAELVYNILDHHYAVKELRLVCRRLNTMMEGRFWRYVLLDSGEQLAFPVRQYHRDNEAFIRQQSDGEDHQCLNTRLRVSVKREDLALLLQHVEHIKVLALCMAPEGQDMVETVVEQAANVEWYSIAVEKYDPLLAQKLLGNVNKAICDFYGATFLRAMMAINAGGGTVLQSVKSLTLFSLKGSSHQEIFSFYNFKGLVHLGKYERPNNYYNLPKQRPALKKCSILLDEEPVNQLNVFQAPGMEDLVVYDGWVLWDNNGDEEDCCTLLNITSLTLASTMMGAFLRAARIPNLTRLVIHDKNLSNPSYLLGLLRKWLAHLTVLKVLDMSRVEFKPRELFDISMLTNLELRTLLVQNLDNYIMPAETRQGLKMLVCSEEISDIQSKLAQLPRLQSLLVQGPETLNDKFVRVKPGFYDGQEWRHADFGRLWEYRYWEFGNGPGHE